MRNNPLKMSWNPKIMTLLIQCPQIIWSLVCSNMIDEQPCIYFSFFSRKLVFVFTQYSDILHSLHAIIFKFSKPETWNTQMLPFLAKLQTEMKQKVCRKQSFDIYIFFQFFGIFGLKMQKIWVILGENYQFTSL